MRIYEFQVQEGFEWVLPISEAEFEVFHSLDGKLQEPNWRPIQVRLVKQDDRGRPMLESDMPWMAIDVPVLRERARATLGPLLEGAAELLPLDCTEARLVVANTTQVIDALDMERSRLVRTSSGLLIKLIQPAFRRDLLTGVRAFKIPQMLRGAVFVSDEIVTAAQSAELRGVGFKLVWDDSTAAA